MSSCAYCDGVLQSLNSYMCHLKVLHSKQIYGFRNVLICGQGGCPITFVSFQALKSHMIKRHSFPEVEQQNSVTEQLSPGCSASADSNYIIDDLNCSYVVESL
jgi:hypothetical protein